MDRRFLLTIVICFAVSMLYMQMIAPEPRTGQIPPVPRENPGSFAERPAVVTGETPQDVNVETISDPVEQFPERVVHLRNRLIDVAVSTVGAAIESVTLEDYQESIEDDSPLKLIGPELESGPAMTLAVSGEPQSRFSIPWQVIEEDLGSGLLVMKLTLGGNRSVIRSYHLPADGYQVTTSVRFEGDWPEGRRPYYRILGASRLRVDPGSRYPNQWLWASRMGSGGVAEVEHESLDVLPGGEEIKPTSVWGAIESNYFAQVVRAEGSDEASFDGKLLVVGEKTKESEARWNTFREQGLQGWPLRVGFQRPVNPGREDSYQLFVGPKDPEVLAQYSAFKYGELIDYGMLGWIVRFFLFLMRAVESWTASWGIAIIGLTFLVRAVLHPMNRKNQRTMQQQQKKMAVIKPQMEEIKKEYKNDPVKQNKMMQQLFKENDVNPAAMFGGCLMIFWQLPIWIALINTFTVAIELRQAGFLYIEDLTRPDQLLELPFTMPLLGSWFNLLPLLYVIVTLVNQRMMPQSDDPQMKAQQRMMTFMMVAFGFIFYTFASGLLLYFLTSATIGIFEQRLIRRDVNNAVPDVAPPIPTVKAKRR